MGALTWVYVLAGVTQLLSILIARVLFLFAGTDALRHDERGYQIWISLALLIPSLTFVLLLIVTR